jgi:prevent-host-death family protein
MKFVNVRTLKMNTAELLEEVEEGEDVVITYHGRPRAMLVKISETDMSMKGSKRDQVLTKSHPFFELIGKGNDPARDVSARKYKYVGRAAERKR